MKMHKGNLKKMYYMLTIIVVTLAIIGYVLFGPHQIYKIPFSQDVFLINVDKNTNEVEKFNIFLDYMEDKGYIYLPEKRMGRIIWFEKDGKEYDKGYPRFIEY